MSALAQNVTEGNIRSSTGEPLQGATITVKGTSRSTVTDSSGHFRIDAPPGSTLVMSYTGYSSREIKASTPDMNIELQSASQDLQQVVVIGYQTVRKKDLTGATGIVDMTDANKLTTASVGEAIQGLVPGVTVRNGGAPGQNAAIEIRGVAALET